MIAPAHGRPPISSDSARRSSREAGPDPRRVCAAADDALPAPSRGRAPPRAARPRGSGPLPGEGGAPGSSDRCSARHLSARRRAPRRGLPTASARTSRTPPTGPGPGRGPGCGAATARRAPHRNSGGIGGSGTRRRADRRRLAPSGLGARGLRSRGLTALLRPAASRDVPASGARRRWTRANRRAASGGAEPARRPTADVSWRSLLGNGVAAVVGRHDGARRRSHRPCPPARPPASRRR